MPQPRHTETSILQSYLLPPSPLPTILSYSAFLQLVPIQYRTHQNLKRLYRDLQFQRSIDIDTVRENIEREVARSVILKSQLTQRIALEQGRAVSDKHSDEQNSKKRKRTSASNNNNKENEDQLLEDRDEFTNPADLAIDTTYLTSTIHPSHTNTANNHPLLPTMTNPTHHTPTTLFTSLTSACSTLRAECSDLESESSSLLAEMNEIIGSLSDLRYGRFARPASGDFEDREGTVEEEVMRALKGLESRLVA